MLQKLTQTQWRFT